MSIAFCWRFSSVVICLPKSYAFHSPESKQQHTFHPLPNFLAKYSIHGSYTYTITSKGLIGQYSSRFGTPRGDCSNQTVHRTARFYPPSTNHYPLTFTDRSLSSGHRD